MREGEGYEVAVLWSELTPGDCLVSKANERVYLVIDVARVSSYVSIGLLSLTAIGVWNVLEGLTEKLPRGYEVVTSGDRAR